MTRQEDRDADPHHLYSTRWWRFLTGRCRALFVRAQTHSYMRCPTSSIQNVFSFSVSGILLNIQSPLKPVFKKFKEVNTTGGTYQPTRELVGERSSLHSCRCPFWAGILSASVISWHDQVPIASISDFNKAP